MTADFSFTLLGRDGAARRGRMTTAHGTVEMPAFMPCGTAATVKAMRPEDVARLKALEKENARLKRLLAEKAMEADFFKGALQKVEARRQRSSSSGEKTSTTRSGN